MKLAYLAGPFRTNRLATQKENINAALVYWNTLTDAGLHVLCPHVQSLLLDPFNLRGEKFWLDYTMNMLQHCDVVYVLPRWLVSEGTRAEIAEAERLGIEVRYLGEEHDGQV